MTESTTGALQHVAARANRLSRSTSADAIADAEAPVDILMIANQAQGTGFSGGDRIFIELAKRWKNRGTVRVRLMLSDEGWAFCEKKGLVDIERTVLPVARFTRLGMALNLLLRTIYGSLQALRTRNLRRGTLIYSTSDFWPDSISAFIMKLVNPGSRWVAGFYLFAPSPFQRDSPYRGRRFLVGLFYWLTQRPIYWLVRRYADQLFVIGEHDHARFRRAGVAENRLVIVRGGVDLKLVAAIPSPPEKSYDAVFIGRFHPQKGGLVLVDIWNAVVRRRPGAKLMMLGDAGPLLNDIQRQIARLGLQDAITVVGHVLDDAEKARVFKASRLVVHPATYDVGGMAACEAMACGLPAVSFDLPGLRTYYPFGMLKVPEGDIEAFAESIVNLLTDPVLYERTREDALRLATAWDWDRRADDLLEAMLGAGKSARRAPVQT